MKTKDYLGCFILFALAVAGYFFDGFYGGIVTGSTTAMLILVLVGKPVYLKAVKRQENDRIARTLDFFENLKGNQDEQ